MPKEILINAEALEKRVAITTDGRLEEFYIERPGDKTIVGNIYKGRIESVVPSLNAAFVDIGQEKKGFLYLSEIGYPLETIEAEEVLPFPGGPNPTGIGLPNPTGVDLPKHYKEGSKPYKEGPKVRSKEVKRGDEFMVQVVKEAFGTKGPRLCGHIGLPGRYLVLMPQEARLGISRRIEDELERKRLRSILEELRLPRDIGFIVRTAAFGRSKQELLRDARFLLKLWARIKHQAQKKPAPSLVYEEYDLVLRIIRDSFTEDVDKLIVDNRGEYARIHKFMRAFLGYLRGRIHLYQGKNLFQDKDIDRQIGKIFEPKVYLKSKAYIIIEPTEGLVVIDVNSGGFKKNLSPEEAAFKVNAEAAVEAARQLRLRDLGGIIVIDFIDMEKEEHRQEILNILNRELSKDRAKYDCLDISKFGLVQMTRERIHNTVQSQILQDCPYCQARGKVKSAQTLGILALRQLKQYLEGSRVSEVNLSLNPSVISFLEKNQEYLNSLEKQFHTKISLISNPTQHFEEIKIT